MTVFVLCKDYSVTTVKNVLGGAKSRSKETRQKIIVA